MDVVIHTRSLPMTGDDHPRPRSGAFQTMFRVSLQARGAWPAAACPCPFGPRNCGQSAGAWPESRRERINEKASTNKAIRARLAIRRDTIRFSFFAFRYFLSGKANT